MSENIKNVNWRSIAAIGVGILLAIFLLDLIARGGMGVGNLNYGHGMGYNLGYNGILASLFLFAIKVLWLVFVFSLFAGIIVTLKKYLVGQQRIDPSIWEGIIPFGLKCVNCGTNLNKEFKYCPGCKTLVNFNCECGQALEHSWKHCPSCGKESGSK